MTKTERLVAMYDHLKKLGKIRTQQDLSALTGYNQGTISAALKGDATDLLLRKVNDATGGLFSAEWLYSGEGEMLKANMMVPPMADVMTIAPGNQGSVYGKVTGDPDALARTLNENKELKEENENLRKENARLEKQVSKLEGQIEVYKSLITK